MEKINFINNVTKANADTFNTMQDNIEDAIDEKDISVQNVYSTTETRIGTWIDGKPLYRAVYSGTTGNAETSFSLSSLNISQLVNTYGMVGSSGDFKPIPFILESGGALYYISARYALGAMYISNSSAYGSKPYYLIIEYTKTTD